VILVAYHQDEYLPQLVQGWPGTEVAVDLPAEETGWPRLAALYAALADAVASDTESPRVVLSGDCLTSLGVLAGLQRAGCDAGVVWIDAHGDVQTMETTTSGYLGGMPVRIMVGYRPELVADAIGLRPVPESRVLLVDARDLDPPEQEYLATAAILRCSVDELCDDALPAGPLLLHVDLDVIDPGDLPGLRFPAPGGAPASAVLEAIRRVLATGRVAAVSIAATWDPSTEDANGVRARLLTELLAAVRP
jgi:arginase